MFLPTAIIKSKQDKKTFSIVLQWKLVCIKFECKVYVLETDVGWLSQRADWWRLNAVGMAGSTVEEKGKVTVKLVFYYVIS